MARRCSPRSKDNDTFRTLREVFLLYANGQPVHADRQVIRDSFVSLSGLAADSVLDDEPDAA